MTTTDQDIELDARRRMGEMVTAYWIPQVIRSAVDLSLADHLAEGAMTATEIATRENSAADTTFRLMRACVTLGLLRAEPDGRFFSTPLLDTLRKNAPGSLRGLALAATLPAQWLAWNEFTTSVRQGGTRSKDVLGTDFFEYLEQHPDQARDFSDGLSSTTPLWTSAAAEMIDTAGVSLAVDVGGANGSLLHLLQEANPDLKGIVFDRPNVVDQANAETRARGLSERTDVIGGDFFVSVPEGGDLYLLKMVMHDWDDASCVTILRNCRAAMRPGGRIAVIEMLVGDVEDPGPAAMMDMAMLAIVPGQERSLAQYDALFAASGLRRTRIHTAASGQSVIEAVTA